jgi:hypothetical protein
MKKAFKSKIVGALFAILLMPQAKAAVVTIGFEQYSKVFIDSLATQSLATGSYFAFGSFSSDAVAGGITQANILSTLRNTSTWFNSFQTSFVDSAYNNYVITTATASTSTDTSPRQFAYAIYINDTFENVRDQLALAEADAGAATGINREFGVFTYSNTVPDQRAALPRAPVDFPGDASSFSTDTGQPDGINNFVAVSGLGNVTASAIGLIPEPSSVSLLLLGLGYVAVARRKTV